MQENFSAPLFTAMVLFVFCSLLSFLVPGVPFHSAALLSIFLIAALGCHDGSAERQQALMARWYLAGKSWPHLGLIALRQMLLQWALPACATLATVRLLLYSHAPEPLETVAPTLLAVLLVTAALMTMLRALLSGQGRGAALALILLMPLFVPLFLFASSAATGNDSALWFLWGQALLWLSLCPWLCGLAWKIQLQS